MVMYIDCISQCSQFKCDPEFYHDGVPNINITVGIAKKNMDNKMKPIDAKNFVAIIEGSSFFKFASK